MYDTLCSCLFSWCQWNLFCGHFVNVFVVCVQKKDIFFVRLFALGGKIDPTKKWLCVCLCFMHDWLLTTFFFRLFPVRGKCNELWLRGEIEREQNNNSNNMMKFYLSSESDAQTNECASRQSQWYPICMKTRGKGCEMENETKRERKKECLNRKLIERLSEIFIEARKKMNEIEGVLCFCSSLSHSSLIINILHILVLLLLSSIFTCLYRDIDRERKKNDGRQGSVNCLIVMASKWMKFFYWDREK